MLTKDVEINNYYNHECTPYNFQCNALLNDIPINVENLITFIVSILKRGHWRSGKTLVNSPSSDEVVISDENHDK